VAVSVLLRPVNLAEQPENFTYTAAEAARILRLSSQRIRQLLASGALRGVRDEVGHWEVDARSVHELLNERREAFSEALEDLLRLSELEAEVRELRYLLGRAEGRLELAKGIESALRAEQEGLQEELARERERADKLKGAQEEADRLREELEAERSKGFWQRLFGRA
jgi:regulator of protease activity HflC (stomatin/prohibitin superfamily)